MIKEKIVRFLRWSEKYTETDMLYATKGSFWILFGKMGIFTVAFIKMIVFGRFLDQGAYGTYTFILSMAAMFGIFSLTGINTSLIKAIAQKKEGTLGLAVKERLKFSLFGSLVSFTVAGWYLYNQNYFLASAFLIVGLFLPSRESFLTYSAFWVGKKNFEKSNKYELLSIFLTALVVVPVIILTNNLILIIIALFSAQSFFDAILLAKTLKQRENNEIMPEAIGFGKNLTVMGAIGTFMGQIDKIILWKFFGPIPLAIYSFAQMPIEKIQGAIPISSLALPKIGERNIGEIKEGILKKFKKLFFIFIPVTFFLIILAPFFYKLILPQYIESVPYFQAFSLLLLIAPFSLFGVSLLSEMKKKELYIIQTIAPISKILFFLVLIPFFGIWGVIISIIISQFIGSILSFYFFKKL